MKKVTVAAAAAVVALGAASAMAAVGNSNIINSKHNLNGKFTGSYTQGDATNTQICIYCHTPHNAKMNVPIWNRDMNQITASSFTLYSSVTMLNTPRKTGFTSDSISLFCMSCHDGSVLGGTMIHSDFNRLYAGQGNLVTGTIATADAKLGQNLSNTHPVNFVADYQKNQTQPQKRNDGQADLIFKDQDTMGPAKSLTSTVTFPLFVSGGQRGYLECSSCHSVHDDYYKPFLRDTMDNSQLCLGCHNK